MLKEIDWSRIASSVGTAEAVPNLLMTLKDSDAAVRESACEELNKLLTDQDAPCEASPRIVPFLVALVLDSAVPDRGNIVELILQNAIGYADTNPKQLPFRPLDDLPFATEVFDVTSSLIPALLPTLQTASEEHAVALITGLRYFPDHAAESIEAVATWMARTDNLMAWANGYPALAFLARDSDRSRAFETLEGGLGSKEPFKQLFAAVGLSLLDGPSVTDEVRARLATFLDHQKDLEALPLAWRAFSLVRHAALASGLDVKAIRRRRTRRILFGSTDG